MFLRAHAADAPYAVVLGVEALLRDVCIKNLEKLVGCF